MSITAKTSRGTAKTSMSVPEMTKLLGLSKVEGYWLVNKGNFRTIMVAGKTRVIISSFEEWYAGQFHYRKVTGEEPGTKWKDNTMSVAETAQLLGITESSLCDLLKKKPFRILVIDHKRRIDKEDFYRWYHSQRFYRTVEDQQEDRKRYQDMLSLPQIAGLLGVRRDVVYYLVKRNYLEVIDSGRQKLVPKDSFEKWYRSQKHYKKVKGDESGIHR